MKPAAGISGRRRASWLALCPLSLTLPVLRAADGTWISNRDTAAVPAVWSDPANWRDGTVADGAGGVASFLYDPLPGDTGSNITLDGPRTIGRLRFGDLDGYGSASIGLFNPPAPEPESTLTLSAPGSAPVIEVDLSLNNAAGGKKAVIGVPLAGSQGLRKSGHGYLALRAANAFSGSLTIDGGELELRGPAAGPATIHTGSTTVSGGARLVLDFGGKGGLNSQANLLDPAAPLVLGGPAGSGIITNTARPTGTSNQSFSQTFGGVTLLAGAHSIAPVVANGGSGQNTTWTLGALARVTGSAVNFQITGAGTGRTVSLTTTTAATDGWLGSWATFNGNDWATVNGSSVGAVPQAFYGNDAWGATVHHSVVNGGTAPDGAAARSLRFGSTSARTITLTGPLTVGSGGILFGGNSSPSHRITGGSLRSGTNELLLHSATAPVAAGPAAGLTGPVLSTSTGAIVTAPVTNGTATTRLVKAGSGTVVLAADCTHTGGTIAGAGMLQLGAGLAGSDTGSVPGPISGSGIVAFNRAGTHVLINPLSGNGTLVQLSPGTLVLDRFTGAGAGLDVRNGTVRLDFTGTAAPTENLLPPAGRLTLRNASVDIRGRAGTANRQTFALTDLNGHARLALTPGAGGSLEVDLGLLNPAPSGTESGGLLLVDLPADAVLKASWGTPGAILDAGGTPVAVINGSDWAARAPTGTQVVPGSAVPGFYTPTSTGIAGHADFDGTALLSAPATAATLRVATPGGGVLTLNDSLAVGGILVTPAVGTGTVRFTGNGSIRALGSGARDLNVVNLSGGLVAFELPVINPDGAGATSIAKSGGGDVSCSGSQPFTGRLTLNEGRLLWNAVSAPRSGALLVRGGELVMGSGSSLNPGSASSIGQRHGEEGIVSLAGNAQLATYDAASSSGTDLSVGDVHAAGTLRIADSGVVLTKNLFVGRSGAAAGTIIQDGGLLETRDQTGSSPGNSDIRFGGNTPGDAAATALYQLNAGTFIASRNLQIGANGTGTVVQTGGTARATAGFTALGRFPSGRGTWNLSGGLLDVDEPASPASAALIVGEQGEGTLTISGDAVLQAPSLSLGHNGGRGTVVQSGGTVSLSRTGTVTYGTVTVPHGLILAAQAGGEAAYHLDGGTLVAQAVTRGAGSSAAFVFNGGTLRPVTGTTAFISGLTACTIAEGGAVIDTDSRDVAIPQALEHGGTAPADGGLVKEGAGNLTLTSLCGFTGPMAVNAGTLTITGGTPSSAGASVGLSGTLSGNGTVGGNVTVAGIHAPGPDIAVQRIGGSLTYQGGGRLAWQLRSSTNGGSGTAFDAVIAGGEVVFQQNSGLDVVLNAPGSTVLFSDAFWAARRTWTIVSGTAVAGTLAVRSVTTDSAGNAAPIGGSFTTRLNGNTLELVWDPGTGSPFATWQQQQFGADAGNPAIAGPEADPDRDGLRNLAEYALGLDPRAWSAAPAVDMDGTSLRLTYTRNLDATDVLTNVQWSTNSAAWEGTGISLESLSVSGSIETLRASVPRGTDLRKQMRLRYTLP